MAGGAGRSGGGSAFRSRSKGISSDPGSDHETGKQTSSPTVPEADPRALAQQNSDLRQVVAVFATGMIITLVWLGSGSKKSVEAAAAAVPEPPAQGASFSAAVPSVRRMSRTRAMAPLEATENPYGANSVMADWEGAARKSAPRPNVVLLLADDLGWADVGRFHALGDEPNGPGVSKPPRTPALDKMADEGTVFTSFYVASPVCSASRATFMTGQWPTSRSIRLPYIYFNKDTSNREKGQSDFLNRSVPTVTRVLKSAGYMTAHYGKWHLGGVESAPAVSDYGMDDSATFGSNPTAMRTGSVGLTQHSPPFRDPSFPSVSSTLIADRVLKFMQHAKEAGKRFYINAWFHIAHAPLSPSKAQLAPFPKVSYCPASGIFPGTYAADFVSCPIAVYHASLLDLDTQVGRVLDAVRKDQDLNRKTLVVYTSDNGPEDEQVYFNAKGQTGPFRGRKRSTYEGGVRVPCIAWWPGHVAAGRITAADFTAFDWLPTMAALGGARLPRGVRGRCDVGACLAGRDASPIVLGKRNAGPRKVPLVWDYRFRMMGSCLNQSPRLAIRDGHLKLLTNHDLSRIELYNTSVDVTELRNLAAEFPAEVERLSRLVLAWARTQAPSPVSSMELNRGCHYELRKIATYAKRDWEQSPSFDAKAALAEARRNAASSSADEDEPEEPPPPRPVRLAAAPRTTARAAPRPAYNAGAPRRATMSAHEKPSTATRKRSAAGGASGTSRKASRLARPRDEEEDDEPPPPARRRAVVRPRREGEGGEPRRSAPSRRRRPVPADRDDDEEPRSTRRSRRKL